MPRPKKPIDGVDLVANLYPDNKGRPGRWRYRRPDGSFKSFAAADALEANRLATEANNLRDRVPQRAADGIDRASIAYHVEAFIAKRERMDPALARKKNWHNRRYSLRAFARHFQAVPIHKLTRPQIVAWWESLTHHQQSIRHTELRRFFNETMGNGCCPLMDYNPFTLSDDRPRLYRTAMAPVARMRLSIEDFWTIYRKADEIGMPGLQIAMGISLLTTMRRADVCALRFDTHISGDVLRQIIGKSAAQRGDVHATRLEWDLRLHEGLAALIRRARELSMKHMRCPFLISHAYKRRKLHGTVTKLHAYQVTPESLDRLFAEARDATELYASLPEGRTPPTFHEIRALSSALFGRAGFATAQIQALMAHTDEDVTKLYQSGQELPYVGVEMQLPADVLAGSF